MSEIEDGRDPRGERTWGIVGGTVGSVVGVGGSLIGLLSGESWSDMSGSPWPPMFERTTLMPLDVWWLSLVLIGMLFTIVALVSIRRSRSPRTHGFGAALTGMILSGLGGTILFVRIVALTS